MLGGYFRIFRLRLPLRNETYLIVFDFKYLLRVFKYLTIAYNNQPVKAMHCH